MIEPTTTHIGAELSDAIRYTDNVEAVLSSYADNGCTQPSERLLALDDSLDDYREALIRLFGFKIETSTIDSHTVHHYGDTPVVFKWMFDQAVTGSSREKLDLVSVHLAAMHTHHKALVIFLKQITNSEAPDRVVARIESNMRALTLLMFGDGVSPCDMCKKGALFFFTGNERPADPMAIITARRFVSIFHRGCEFPITESNGSM